MGREIIRQSRGQAVRQTEVIGQSDYQVERQMNIIKYSKSGRKINIDNDTAYWHTEPTTLQ